MPLHILEPDARVVLNHATKHLVRLRGASSEPWRFPIVDTCPNRSGSGADQEHNRVTFVWDARDGRPSSVEVTGSCMTDGQPVQLVPVALPEGRPTGFLAATVAVPFGEVHTYRFLVDGVPTLDPVNPQRVRLDNGVERSRFFTWYCTQPMVLERHERALVQRLTSHILPFRSGEGETFLRRHYHALDKASKTHEVPLAYRLDEAVGAVSYIDALLAREEAHRLMDYRLALGQVRRVMAIRHRGVPIATLPREAFVDLYAEMASDNVPGWDRNVYGSPAFFLRLLRRHTFTGAFSHPRYGGNASAVGWAFLAERHRDVASGATLFDWQRSIEKPWGRSPDYHG